VNVRYALGQRQRIGKVIVAFKKYLAVLNLILDKLSVFIFRRQKG
jgi:hypothetical protein